MMNYIRKNRKKSIVVLIFLIVIFLVGVTFGKYVLGITREFLLETKAFYFRSSILNINGKRYSINNWDGVNSYTLTFDVTNRNGPDKITKSDISYDISISCSGSVTCRLSKNKGIIYQNEESDTYQVTITPQKNFYSGDSVVVKTSVTSTSPYKKTMSATYNIGVEKSKFSYQIEDSVNSKFLTLVLTNSVTYYEVKEAFGSYKVGSQVSLEEYATLSDEEKAKCFSAIVTLSFDPNNIFVDMTDRLYLDRFSDNYQTQKVNGYDYVSKFSFALSASSSKTIKFYKDDMTKDYTYPIVNDSSIIDVSVKTAN